MRKRETCLLILAGLVLAASVHHPAISRDANGLQPAVACCQSDVTLVTLSAKGKGKGKGKGSEQQQYMQYEMHDAMITRTNRSGGSKSQSGNNPSSMSGGKKR